MSKRRADIRIGRREPFHKTLMSKRLQKPPPRHGNGQTSAKERDLRNALALQQRGQLSEAERLCRNVLQSAPKDFHALHLLAGVKHQQGQTAEALELIKAALRERPDSVPALSNYGLLLNQMNRLDDALAIFDRLLAINPKDAKALNNRGNTLHALRRFAEAAESYSRAIAAEERYAEAFNNRGLALKELNRFHEALENYDRAIALQPDYAGALNNRAVVLTELGRLAEAKEAAERAVRLAPGKVPYYFTLGNTRPYTDGDPSLAKMEALARDAGNLSVDDQIELRFALAKAYEDLGRSDSAFDHLLKGNALKRRHMAYDEAATLGALDRIRAVFTPDVFRDWQNTGDPSPLPIFIIGMPRSGTTLLEQILASHSQVFGGGELNYLAEAVHKLCRPQNGLPAYPEAVARMAHDQFRQLGAAYLAEVKRLAPQAVRIADKMPSNYLYAGLIHLALPSAIIIHAQRDPVDTCVSCFSKLFTVEQCYTYDLEELGRYYQHYQKLMAHWHRVLPPGRILDVRYEDLVANLEGQARRILGHCGLDWEPGCLAFHKTERAVRTASAAQVRQPIYKSAVGRWRAYEQKLGPLISALGLTEMPSFAPDR